MKMNILDDEQKVAEAIERLKRQSKSKGAKRTAETLKELMRRPDFIQDILAIRKAHSIPETGIPDPSSYNEWIQTYGREIEKSIRGAVLDVMQKYNLYQFSLGPAHPAGIKLEDQIHSYVVTGLKSLLEHKWLGNVCFLSHALEGYCSNCGGADKSLVCLAHPITIHINPTASQKEVKSFIDQVWTTEIEPLQLAYGKTDERRPREKKKLDRDDWLEEQSKKGFKPKQIYKLMRESGLFKGSLPTPIDISKILYKRRQRLKISP